jgi:hypothetical protein
MGSLRTQLPSLDKLARHLGDFTQQALHKLMSGAFEPSEKVAASLGLQRRTEYI